MLHGLGTGPWTRRLLMDCLSCTRGESGSSRACRGGRTGNGSSWGLIRASKSQLRTGIFFANEQNVAWTRVHVSTEKIPTIWGGYWCSSSNEEEEFCASESSIYSRCIILCASHSYSFVRATNQSYDLNSIYWLYPVLGACYLLCSLLSGKFDKLCGKGAKSRDSFQVNQFRVNLHSQKWVGGLQASRVKQFNELLHGVRASWTKLERNAPCLGTHTLKGSESASINRSL